MNNSSAIAEFKKQADKLIEEEVHEHYNKSPGNVSLGKKYWPDVWKRLQSLNSKVQIFDHPMPECFQWEKKPFIQRVMVKKSQILACNFNFYKTNRKLGKLTWFLPFGKILLKKTHQGSLV